MRIPWTMPGREPPADSGPAHDAGREAATLYLTYYRPLVRLAALLLPDPARAEDIVQDSFDALRAAGPAKPAADDALGYLQRSVVIRCRSVRRAATRTEHSAFASALWTRPAWQREVLALRYFAELSGTPVAAAPGINWDAARRRIAWAGLRRWARSSGHPRPGRR